LGQTFPFPIQSLIVFLEKQSIFFEARAVRTVLVFINHCWTRWAGSEHGVTLSENNVVVTDCSGEGQLQTSL